MRDTHRMREKYDLSLDSRQVVSLLIGGIVVLGAVFVLGVLVGKKLAGTPRADRAPDLLTALDHKSDALERARAAPPLTFQEELTKPVAPTPTVVRAPAASAPAASALTAPGSSTGATAHASSTPAAASSSSVAPVSGPAAAPAASAVASKPTLPRPAAVPAPATAEVKAEKKAELSPRQATAESVVTRSAPAAAHPTPKVPEATSATGAFTLQLGASPNRDDAERQASRLREKGYAPYIVAAEVPGKGTWYRVRMGSFPSKDAATRYLQDFKRETQAEAFVASTR
ncbi:MAG TPA: SPOR domain-containing protein [Myxococcaceae bacterium]|nr:SPOR domain-containing protein [Myxococcaceae bacterium]